jgi:hypothetical protein
MSLDELTLATFTPLVGEPFTLAAPGEPLELVLESATAVGGASAGRDPFSLVFRGPPEPLLEQAIHRFEHPGLGALEIFVVPLGRDAGGARYEAVFT